LRVGGCGRRIGKRLGERLADDHAYVAAHRLEARVVHAHELFVVMGAGAGAGAGAGGGWTATGCDGAAGAALGAGVVASARLRWR
jgi:hypothetical protein